MQATLELLQRYQSLELSSVINYDKFDHYSITHHSTQLEGSTLTEIETQLLLEEELTPKGKPLMHSLMVKDHYQALLFVLAQAKEQKPITSQLIKDINARVLKNTGAIYQTVLGTVNSTEGEYRLGNVRAGNRYFANYAKVPHLREKLCQGLSETISPSLNIEELLHLSFDAHFDLVSIHPFYDGNGRTARLLMNYIQAFFGLPLSIVFSEDKGEYIEALEKSREQENLQVFRSFMKNQYKKYLQTEIDRYLDGQKPKRSGDYSFVF